jgi:hypothetical protein
MQFIIFWFSSLDVFLSQILIDDSSGFMLTDSLTSLSKNQEDSHGSLPPKVRRYITHCYTQRSGENAGCIKALLQLLYLSEKAGFLPDLSFILARYEKF